MAWRIIGSDIRVQRSMCLMPEKPQVQGQLSGGCGLRAEFSETPCKTTIQLPFTVIHHAGATECSEPTHQSLNLPGNDHSTVVPAPSLLSRLWARSKYAQGYIKIHQGTRTYWQKKGRDELALSEGTNLLDQHEGGRMAVSEGSGDIAKLCAGPSLPFPCSKCPNYSEPVIYSRKCYYEPQCFIGQGYALYQMLRRLIARS